MTVETNTRAYEFSHGHKPRGVGQWAFEVRGETFWAKPNQTYGNAKAEAVAFARTKNAREVTVCP